MTKFTPVLAVLALMTSASIVASQEVSKDDCKEQSATDDDA